MAEKEKVEKKDEIELVEVPTQTAPAFKVPGDENPYTLEGYLVWLGNVLFKLEKKL